jgi:hypothetical protein
MKRLALLGPLALALLHCGSAPPPAAVQLGGDAAPAPVAIASPGAPIPDRFPGGPGTTLVDDQLSEALGDPAIRDGRTPVPDRVEAAQKRLGIPGEADGPDWVFRAVTARTILGPYGCRELRIHANVTSTGPADHRACGLPYLSQNGTDWKPGTGPRWTVGRLRRVQGELASRPDATKEVSKPDVESANERVWWGIGPRDADGPITCWALRVPTSPGAAARVTSEPLASCGIAWPPPAAAFERGPQPPAVPIEEKRRACTACDPSQLCVIDQTSPHDARTFEANGLLRAAFMDGRPAPLAVTQSCADRPAGWSLGPGSTPGAGVCPNEGHYGTSVRMPAGKAPVVQCQRWLP